jgi:formylglycine-generating enzyme required for sulfatase activity
MGANPSRFRSADRPVESVSWEDCQEFLALINQQVPGLELVLPTEAQWEYACRAGTQTATYAGDLRILGESNAPALDAIAWYGGNSGVDFELDNGWNSSEWPEKQYEHTRAGSHPVTRKQPNPWGLYDMLGNVSEWCSDWYGDYSDEIAIDPSGPADGSQRVLRGASWIDSARMMRSARRSAIEPVSRNGPFGFRCARVQEREQ